MRQSMETAKAKSEKAVIWSKQNLEPPGKTDGGEEARGVAHVRGTPLMLIAVLVADTRAEATAHAHIIVAGLVERRMGRGLMPASLAIQVTFLLGGGPVYLLASPTRYCIGLDP